MKHSIKDPELLMASAVASTVTTSHKPRLLLACASTLLAISKQTHYRLGHTNGPIGSLTFKLSSVAIPISRRLHRPLLSLLSFADDRLLSAEALAAYLFPPAHHLFDEIHRVAKALPASLPQKVDGAFDVLQWVVAHLPLLGGAVEKSAAFVNWALEAVGWPAGEERVIGVDVGCERKGGDAGKVEADFCIGEDSWMVLDEVCERGLGDEKKHVVVEGEESDGVMSCGQKSFVTADVQLMNGDKCCLLLQSSELIPQMEHAIFLLPSSRLHHAS